MLVAGPSLQCRRWEPVSVRAFESGEPGGRDMPKTLGRRQGWKWDHSQGTTTGTVVRKQTKPMTIKATRSPPRPITRIGGEVGEDRRDGRPQAGRAPQTHESLLPLGRRATGRRSRPNASRSNGHAKVVYEIVHARLAAGPTGSTRVWSETFATHDARQGRCSPGLARAGGPGRQGGHLLLETADGTLALRNRSTATIAPTPRSKG